MKPSILLDNVKAVVFKMNLLDVGVSINIHEQSSD
jgi:hypothetical protein